MSVILAAANGGAGWGVVEFRCFLEAFGCGAGGVCGEKEEEKDTGECENEGRRSHWCVAGW